MDHSLDQDGTRSHHRSTSHDSDVSVYSEDAAPQAGPSMARSPRSPRPPRLHLDALSTSSRKTSPGRSPESYLPTPDESVSSAEDESTQSTARQQAQQQAQSPFSYGTPRRDPKTQKSLPELRPNGKHSRSVSRDPPSSGLEQFGIPSPPHRQESDSSNGSMANFRLGKVVAQGGVVASPVSMHPTVPPMDAERNSYFRRLSALTPTLSKTIPSHLLALIDAVRGILFSVCQIYQTLQHYTINAIDERLSAVLHKVLHPATACMAQLIHALDRFDSISRRTLPSTTVCRAVVETCKENVVVFSKAVGVLSLQLKVISANDDARYTRQMLLTLYGATAEISNAWRSIANQMESVKPFLRHHRPSPIRATHNVSFPLPSATFPPVTAPPAPSELSPAPRPHLARSNSNGVTDGKVRFNRRHAGSFSYKDLEIGKMLPSYIEEPIPSAGLTPATHSPALRSGRRTPAATSNGGLHHDGTIRPSTSTSRWDSHSRQSSASSFLPSSTSSPSLGHKPPALDMSSATVNWIDKEAIDAVKAAVEAATTVCDMTDEMLMDDPTVRAELQVKLCKARDVTDRLHANIRLLELGDADVDRPAIRDDAHVFANVSYHILSLMSDANDTLDCYTASQLDQVVWHHASFASGPAIKHGNTHQRHARVRDAPTRLVLYPRPHSSPLLSHGRCHDTTFCHGSNRRRRPPRREFLAESSLSLHRLEIRYSNEGTPAQRALTTQLRHLAPHRPR